MSEAVYRIDGTLPVSASFDACLHRLYGGPSAVAAAAAAVAAVAPGFAAPLSVAGAARYCVRADVRFGMRAGHCTRYQKTRTGQYQSIATTTATATTAHRNTNANNSAAAAATGCSACAAAASTAALSIATATAATPSDEHCNLPDVVTQLSFLATHFPCASLGQLAHVVAACLLAPPPPNAPAESLLPLEYCTAANPCALPAAAAASTADAAAAAAAAAAGSGASSAVAIASSSSGAASERDATTIVGETVNPRARITHVTVTLHAVRRADGTTVDTHTLSAALPLPQADTAAAASESTAAGTGVSASAGANSSASVVGAVYTHEVNRWGQVDILYESPVAADAAAAAAATPSSTAPVSAGLYRLNVAPQRRIPWHHHLVMHECELILSDALLCNDQPLPPGANAIGTAASFALPNPHASPSSTSSSAAVTIAAATAVAAAAEAAHPLAPTEPGWAQRGATHSWAHGMNHTYYNPSCTVLQPVLCIDVPAFIPTDEVIVAAPPGYVKHAPVSTPTRVLTPVHGPVVAPVVLTPASAASAAATPVTAAAASGASTSAVITGGASASMPPLQLADGAAAAPSSSSSDGKASGRDRRASSSAAATAAAAAVTVATGPNPVLGLAQDVFWDEYVRRGRTAFVGAASSSSSSSSASDSSSRSSGNAAPLRFVFPGGLPRQRVTLSFDAADWSTASSSASSSSSSQRQQPRVDAALVLALAATTSSTGSSSSGSKHQHPPQRSVGLVLVRHARRGWELPGGKCDPLLPQPSRATGDAKTAAPSTTGELEAPVVAAARELWEEAGLRVAVDRFHAIAQYSVIDDADDAAAATAAAAGAGDAVHTKRVFAVVLTDAERDDVLLRPWSRGSGSDSNGNNNGTASAAPVDTTARALRTVFTTAHGSAETPAAAPMLWPGALLHGHVHPLLSAAERSAYSPLLADNVFGLTLHVALTRLRLNAW